MQIPRLRGFAASLGMTLGLLFPLEAQQAGYITTPDSARLFYRTVGRGPDTLIAIHGGPGVDLESIAGDFAPLAERHVVIFYDQRGTGRSTLPRDTMRLNAVPSRNARSSSGR